MPHFCGRTHSSHRHVVSTSSGPIAEQAASATRVAPTREEIAALAHSYWEARGKPIGSPEVDWLRAERELRRRAVIAPVGV